MKYFKRIIILFFVLIILRIGLPFLDLYPYKLTESYYLIGTGNKSYIIKKGVFGKTLINNMNRQCEWIITPKSIYGLKGSINNFTNDYFYIDKKTDSVCNFDSLSALNKFLKDKGLEDHSMSDSENLVHLKYGNGRNRKFM